MRRPRPAPGLLAARLVLPVALALAVTAAALDALAPARAAARDVIVMLDNSGSMKKNDPAFLTAVAVHRFLERLVGDTRVGLLLFDQSVRLVQPLTVVTDETRPAFLRSLGQVDYRGLLTDSPAAMERAIEELVGNARPDADKAIIFMTDGIVDTGDKARDVERSRWLQEELSAEAAKAGIRVYGIAFTEHADFQLIQSLARRTSGAYFRAFRPDDIDDAFDRILGTLAAPVEAPIAASTPSSGPSSGPGAPRPPEPAASSEPAPLPAEAAPLPAEATAPALAAEAGSVNPDAAPVLPVLPDTSPGSLPVLPDASPPAAAPPLPDGGPPVLPTLPDAPPPAPEPEPPPAPAPQVSAPVPPAPPEQAAPGNLPVPLPLPILIAAALALLVIVAATIYLLKRRGPGAAPAGPALPRALLNDIGGVTGKASHDLVHPLTVIGRVAAQGTPGVGSLVIPESTIGRRHAVFEYRNVNFWVIDQNSLNGTFVNGHRLEGETRLKHGDRVRFHKHEFEFLLVEMLDSDRTMMSETAFVRATGDAPDDDPDVTRARTR